MVGARLTRFGDMTTEDFLLERTAPVVADGSSSLPVAPDALPAPWTSCSMDGPVRLVDLNTGSMIPLQVALASRGERSVALVTLGRPLRGRQGFSFPASRWVEWEGEVTTVSDGPGFAPDASLVLREHDAAVLSYERDAHGASGPAGRSTVLTRFGVNRLEPSPEFRELMAFQAQRARAQLAEGLLLLDSLDRRSALCVRT